MKKQNRKGSLPAIVGIFDILNRTTKFSVLSFAFFTLFSLGLIYLLLSENGVYDYILVIIVSLTFMIAIYLFIFCFYDAKLVGVQKKSFRISTISALLGTIGALIVALLLYLLASIYTYSVETYRILRLVTETEVLMDLYGGYEDILIICQEYNYNEYVTGNDLLNGKLRYVEGKCYYELASKNDDVNYLIRSGISSSFAYDSFKRCNNYEGLLKARNLIALNDIALSESGDKIYYLEKVKKELEELYSTIIVGDKSQKPLSKDEVSILLNLADVYLRMSKIREKEGNLKKAEKILLTADTIIDKEKDTLLDAEIKYRLSSLYNDLSSIRYVKEYLNRSTKYGNVARDLRNEGLSSELLLYIEDSFEESVTMDSINNKGVLLKQIKSFEDGIIFFGQKETIVEYAERISTVGSLYLFLSRIEEPKKNLEKAIIETEKALQLLTANKHPYLCADLKNTLGVLYSELFMDTGKEEYIDKAFDLFEDALRVYKVNLYPYYYADIMKNVGRAHFYRYEQFMSKNDIIKAKDCLMIAMKIYNQRDFPLVYARLLGELDSY